MPSKEDKLSKKVTIVGIVLNAFLFVIKIAIGIITNSLIVISEALNSLTDIIASIGIYIAVKISRKKADADHPFGHHRAEPIAGLIVAIFAGILGFEVIRTSITEIFVPETLTMGYLAVMVLTITLIVKVSMFYYFRYYGKKFNSPAILATSVDARNDMIVATIALTGIIGQMLSIMYIDNVVAIIFGIYIIHQGYQFARDNIDYLMGKAPDKEKTAQMRKLATMVKGVRKVNQIRAHYVGNMLHVEIEIMIDKNLSTKESHDIGTDVQDVLESLNYVDEVFVHLEPI